jgi:subtilase family serine protease
MGSWRHVCLRVSTCAAAAVLTVTPLHAADIYVAAGASLQAAIDSAQPGDRLLLAPGATFTGNFRLTNKGAATTYITIRSAAADTLLPPDGVRITPADAPNLPIIRSPNTAPALTAVAGAHHWRLQWLEFRANDRGYNEIISLGKGDTTQTLLSQVPHHLILDRLYLRGDPALGQKRGIALNSGATWVLNSYIADMKGVGFDTQAIQGSNGPGPYTIVNNYLEAAGENFLLGGASPKILNLVPADIEFSGNHLYKPLAWRTPIVATPGGVTAVAGGSGALPAATYSYRVLAARKTAQDAWAYSPRSAEVTVAVGAAGRVTVSWAPVAGATTYRVYRGSAAGAQDRYFGTAATSFVDDGAAAGVADTGTWATGTRWTVKNLFELKVGERVRVHGNLLEHSWKESQVGAAVLLTPRNPDATSPGIYVRDVTFTGNLVRHAGGGFQIEGYDSSQTTAQTRRITIADNIFDDITAATWGGTGRWIQIGSGPSDVTIDHNTVLHDGPAIFVYGGSYGAEQTVANLRFTNNLLKHNTYGIVGNGRGYGTDTLTAYFPGALLQRNTLAGGASARYPAGTEFPTVAYWQGQFVDVAASNFALIAGSGYRASGTDAMDLGAPVAQVEAAALAALQGGTEASPPLFISTTALPAGRTGTAYAFTLQATGGSGTYGWTVTAGALPLGLSLAATGVLSGIPAQPGTFPITVRAQDAGDPANAFTQSLSLTIASTPPVVSLTAPLDGATLVGSSAALVASASDPDGTVKRIDFYANATILGSASVAPWSITWDHIAPGTYRLTAVATDNDGLTTTSAAANVAIVAPVTIDTIVLPEAQAATPYAVTLVATGGTGVYAWRLAAGQLPAGVSLGASSGVIAGTPSQQGKFSFTVSAQDASDATNATTRSYTLSIGSSPDLLVSALAAPASAAAGSAIAVSDTTSNSGGGSAGASVTRFYVSRDFLVDATDALLGSRPVSALGTGAISSASTTVTLPAGLTSGTYYVMARADAAGDVPEGNESNNTRAAIIRIGADLTVAAVTAPATGAAGSPIAISDTITNTGAGAAAASVTRFYLSANGVLDAGDTVLGARAVPALPGGASNAASSLMTIPATMTAGAYFIIGQADANATVAETSEVNNTRVGGLVKIGADLVVSVAMPPPVGAGVSFVVTDTTKNSGAAPADGTSTAIYLSANAVLDAADVLLGTRLVPALGLNGTHTASTTVQIPASTPTGTYYLLAMADADRRIAEGNEANNTAAAIMQVGSDLIVTALLAPASAASGTAITVTDTVKNQGGGTAAASVTTFYLSTNLSLDTNDTLLAARPVGSLNTGGTASGSTVMTLPAGLPTASFYVIAVADGDVQVSETSETNNSRAVLVRVSAAP